jgi:carboxyl-terminal processing protease
MPLRNLAWLVGVPAAVLVGLAIASSAPAPDKDYRLVRQVVDVLAEVDAHYVRELSDADRQKLVEDMINGGLHQLDPHSEYLNADHLKQFETASEGSYGGVGITLGVDPKTRLLKVATPMPGGPAYEAGLLAEDLIARVGDQTTENMTIDKARELITGPVGTPVTLTIRRDGHAPPEWDVTLTRAKIELHPVGGLARRKDDPARWEWFPNPADKIAVVRLKGSFNELTAKELRAAVAEVEAAGGRALVLDLRDNPGGLLSQAIEVADLFLPGGRIVSTKDRRGSERVFSAKSEGTIFQPEPGNPRPMAVLVNRNTASASEIVAAALQDAGRAVVVGERSYGKGSVQKLLRLGGDPPAAVKLTTETYHRPSGKNIHRYPDAKETDEWGVRPDPGLEVPTTEAERLRYLLEMMKLEYVGGKPGAGGAAPRPMPVPKGADGKPLIDDSKPFDDRVLDKAVEVLRGKMGG